MHKKEGLVRGMINAIEIYVGGNCQNEALAERFKKDLLRAESLVMRSPNTWSVHFNKNQGLRFKGSVLGVRLVFRFLTESEAKTHAFDRAAGSE